MQKSRLFNKKFGFNKITAEYNFFIFIVSGLKPNFSNRYWATERGEESNVLI